MTWYQFGSVGVGLAVFGVLFQWWALLFDRPMGGWLGVFIWVVGMVMTLISFRKRKVR